MCVILLCTRGALDTWSRGRSTAALYVMKNTLVALLAASVGAAASAQDAAPNVSPSIAQVASGGHWEAGAQRGAYRAIVENQGFEHVSSRLWLEWIAEPTNSQVSQQVVAKVEVAEVRGWSVRVEFAQPPSTLRVAATNPHSLEERVFTVELGGAVKYRVLSQ
jgi:hypothetical protein